MSAEIATMARDFSLWLNGVGAALGAIEHLTGHEGRSLDIATERVRFVCERVGVDTGAASPTEQATEGGA